MDEIHQRWYESDKSTPTPKEIIDTLGIVEGYSSKDP